MNTKKEEEKKDEMTKKERDMMSKMSKTEVIKKKWNSKCNDSIKNNEM